jgi:predicted extracellular nuclease
MRSRLLTLLIILGILSALGITVASAQNGTPVFINEFHYDNSGTDSGEAIEIAGPEGTDLTGWSLVLYNGNGGASYNTETLSGTIPDQGDGFGIVVVNYPSNGIQNGSPDGMALVDSSDGVVQFLSYEGSFTATSGPAAGLTSTDIGVSEPYNTTVGYSLQLVGTGLVYEDFSWSGPSANTFENINTGQTFAEVVNAPVVVNCGGTLYVDQGFDASREVTAYDDDGIVDSLEISSITPWSDAITLDDVTPATEVGGEASATVSVGTDVDADTFSVEITAANNESEPQTGSCTFDVVVNPFLTIGEVQGVVEDLDDGTSHQSPYVDQYVVIQGVIYGKTRARTSWGGSYYGFFMQNTAGTSDGNPLSSDGIFVFMYTYTDLIGGYVPQVGDEIFIRGEVGEYYNHTQISSARHLQTVRTGVDLDLEVPAFETDPPDDLADANRYWERREGMRAQVPSGSIVLNGRDVFASSADSEIWVAHGDSAIAQRIDPYERRAFRDAHPLDDIPDELFDNGNGYRIIMGGLGVKAVSGDNATLLSPARTYDTLINAPVGGVYYSYGKYQIQVEQQLELVNGVDPASNAPPESFDRSMEYSIVTFNVENLYDYYDDPFDDCDFHTDLGCPGVDPPFDYVPASEAVYQTRLNEIAWQIISDLHSPDVIMTQEVEDQDVCTVIDLVYTCGTTDYADGKPDTLQELATVIASLGGPVYDAAYDRDGADDRGIVSAYLYRTDRVELLPAQADDPVLGNDPQVDYPDGLPYNTDVQNPKVLNADLPDYALPGADGVYVFTRPPQVSLFRMWRDGVGESVFTDLYITDNHFSSGPDRRVEQRTEQANYNAAIVVALQEADPEVYVTVGGDLNVYPRPDDPFPTDTSDQLAALYNQGLINLYDIQVAETPVSTFGYVYQGQTQTLDQMFVSSSWMEEFAQVRSAHINSDFPADHVGDGPRGTSDHDPQAARYTLLPTLDRLEALVHYYDAIGEIYGNKTLKIMLDRIDRARRFESRGQMSAYLDQLYAFASQAQDFAPDQMSQVAADALAQEALLLISLY